MLCMMNSKHSFHTGDNVLDFTDVEFWKFFLRKSLKIHIAIDHLVPQFDIDVRRYTFDIDIHMHIVLYIGVA